MLMHNDTNPTSKKQLSCFLYWISHKNKVHFISFLLNKLHQESQCSKRSSKLR